MRFKLSLIPYKFCFCLEINFIALDKLFRMTCSGVNSEKLPFFETVRFLSFVPVRTGRSDKAADLYERCKSDDGLSLNFEYVCDLRIIL